MNDTDFQDPKQMTIEDLQDPEQITIEDILANN